MVALAGLVGLADTFWGPIWPTAPEVLLTGSDPDLPFAFPYQIKNDSVLFPLEIQRWDCTIDEAQIGTNIFTRVGSSKGNGASLPPRGSTNFGCGMSIIGYHISEAKMTVTAHYKDLFGRATLKACYQWIDAGGASKWIEGCEIH